ncbi:MAG: heme lyase CcmF/NrfE family subunit [Chloroflexi bacterium]|nr:heme lyase CcmF/NrfE family subunit [Chloroflexota bacterium]
MYDIAYLALALAFIVALFSILASVIGARRGQPELVASARNGIYAICGLIMLASLILLYAFLRSDFSLEYVASYSSREMATIYKMAAFYGGNKGSLMFWSIFLAVAGAIVVRRNWDRHHVLIPYVMAVILATQAFFLLLMLFVSNSNPFEKLAFVIADGRGLNPLLENAGMLVHPPTQLWGYAGFTIPFAFAIAALVTKRLGDEWVISIRRWTIVAWLLLGLGNLLGGWWAYQELGWGGMWGWDPVENAGLMPWLVGTAFLHSIMLQKRRGMLRIWNIVLVILAFNLSLFGTFLTRSGVLSSVHSFGESALGAFFLGFIGLSLAGSTLLLALRWNDLRSEDEIDSMVSRESAFLFNNLILLGATFAIFLGTIFPVLSEAVRGTKVAVGPPFFNQVIGPIFMALILLMGICPLIGWHKASSRNLLRNFLYPLVVAVVVAVVLLAVGLTMWYAVVSFAVSAFVFSTILLEWFRGTRARHRTRRENYLRAFFSLVLSNRPRYGGYIVHLAILLMAIGIVGMNAYKLEVNAALKPGESMSIGGYELTYEGMTSYPTQKREVVVATMSVYNGGHRVDTLSPQQTFHQNFETVTDVAIRSNPIEDLYLILVSWDEQGVTSFKAIINPLVLWVWIGGVLMIIGAVIAFWPDRRRQAVSRPSPAQTEDKGHD